MTTRTLNTRHYLSGELYGIETAHRRGYVSARQYDDDLAMDWYGICCEEGMPFVQCAFRSKYHSIDYDLKPFLDRRSDLSGLNDVSLMRLRHMASAFCKASPSSRAKHHLTSTSGLITSIPRDDAHALARSIAKTLRDMSNYRGEGGL